MVCGATDRSRPGSASAARTGHLAGGSSEITPNDKKPTLTVTTGADTPGSVDLRVVEGELEFTSD